MSDLFLIFMINKTIILTKSDYDGHICDQAASFNSGSVDQEARFGRRRDVQAGADGGRQQHRQNHLQQGKQLG